MTKNELKAIVEANKMEMIKHHITNQTLGFWVDSTTNIPDLDALSNGVNNLNSLIISECEYLPNGVLRYRVYCPLNWLDLWGFAD